MFPESKHQLISGFNVIAIYVSDLARAKDFYVNVLGMKFDEKNSAGGNGVILHGGGLMFYVEGGRTHQVQPGMTANTISPTFASSSIRHAYNILKEQGVPIVEEYNQPNESFAMFRIADPDGNVIEFAGKP